MCVIYDYKKFVNLLTEELRRAMENMEMYEKIREDLFQRIHMETISRVVKQRSLSRWSKLHL